MMGIIVKKGGLMIFVVSAGQKFNPGSSCSTTVLKLNNF